ncbi:hypothetical protein SUGI_0863170 [Cryptomeria japonica]|uniref:uncharacterized protein LOC131054674 isoform X1 n=1 Tax=Cryptomeria japonica TaxID=3369 RepID=UPI002414851D|nr:uncharacterized protein LOC131054674 isoform X1 [Cryptomeria japonica]GLJ41706.1 hypothetical protein SUGI_0863170 [Cryptomeria japonica]
MMDTQMHEDTQEHPNSMEDRTLPLLHDSKIDQEIQEVKVKKKGGRKHKAKWLKRPMALSDVIVELYETDLRENALRCLSNHLNERREEEPDKYSKAGFFIFHACGIMAILLQEVLSAFVKMKAGDLNIRGSKRLANVLTLFQCTAANKEIRGKFVNAHIPNYLVPFILFENTEEYVESVRAIALSVIGIAVQAREMEVIRWAIKNSIMEVCLSAIDIGSELSKVIAMHIMETILQTNYGITYVCESNTPLLDKLLKMCEQTVLALVREQDFSPRPLFHVIRCYILLCKNHRALELIKKNLPEHLLNNTFHEITEEFPVINQLLNQLLLNVGKLEDIQVMVKSKINYQDVRYNSKYTSPSEVLIPMNPRDLNKEYWPSSGFCPSIPLFYGKEN